MGLTNVRRVGAALASLTLLLSGVATVVARAEPDAAYVALGDSYTAGPLVPAQGGTPAGCQRSDQNYPHVVAATLGLALHDVSCSGATTAHLFAPQPIGGGPNPPQLDAVRPGTSVVTVGIGGNDIGFGGIVTACVAALPVGTSCQARFVTPAGDEISRRIAGAAPKVAAVLAEIRRRAPSARVFAVGYPAILPENDLGCWPFMPFATIDVPYLRAKLRELNAMIAAQATAAGATYVDVYGPSYGRDACGLPGFRWVEPVVPILPAAPVHPNADGMRGMAAVVAAAIGGTQHVPDPAVAVRVEIDTALP